MSDVYDIEYLINYCKTMPVLYNEVANHLWDRFGIRGAEICLLVTYYISEERKKHE